MEQAEVLTPQVGTTGQTDRIISTTYVPLQPPYQIIKWSGLVGMQIGTFIVTIQKEGNMNGMGYHIETHSHPVVAYENKKRYAHGQHGTFLNSDPQLYSSQIMEGTVWDQVELKDVRTICMAETTLRWDTYVEFLRREVMDAPPGKLPNTPIVMMLEQFGVTVEAAGKINHFESNKAPDLTVWLDHATTSRWGGRSMICTRKGCPIVLCSDDNGGVRDIMTLFVKQLYKWGVLFMARPNLGGDFLRQPIHYATEVDSEVYRFVVDELNNRYATLRDIIHSGGYYQIPSKSQG